MVRRSGIAVVTVVLLALAACETGDDEASTASTGSDTGTSGPGRSDPATTSPARSTTAPAPTTTTEPATSSTPTSAPTTAPPESARPQLLAGWPPAPPPPTLDEVPFLLPSEPIDGVVDAIRLETEDPPGDEAGAGADHLQFWTLDGGSSQLTVRTHLDGGPVGSEEFRMPLEIAPWSSAFTFETSSPTAGVTLVAPDGYVTLESYGIPQDEVIAAAAVLRRRPGQEPGWELPGGRTSLVPVHEGWSLAAIGTASRDMKWYGEDGRLVAELSISRGQPMRFPRVWSPERTAGIDEVGGNLALVVEYDLDRPVSPTAVLWSPAPGEVVQFGVLADRERALELARGIEPVPEDVWNSVSREPEFTPDGCQTFVC